MFEPPLDDRRIQGASIDLTLHNVFHRSILPKKQGIDVTVDLAIEAYDYLERFETDELIVPPKGFYLGQTAEAMSVPDDLCGWIEGKSGKARHGLIIHCTAPHIAPTWGYSPPRPVTVLAPPTDTSVPGVSPLPKRITLEIVNLGDSNLKLVAGLPIAQVIFMRLGQPVGAPYTGRHHNRAT